MIARCDTNVFNLEDIEKKKKVLFMLPNTTKKEENRK